MSFFHHHPRKKSRKTHDSIWHRLTNDPYLDWLTLVVISAILSGIGIGAGFIMYTHTRDRLSAPQTSDQGAHAATFNVETLSKVLKEFDQRAVERGNIIKGYVGVSDPSL